MNGRTVDGGGVAQEGDRVGERDLELLQQELRDEGRQPSSVEVAHEGLQRDEALGSLVDLEVGVGETKRENFERNDPSLTFRSGAPNPNQIASKVDHPQIAEKKASFSGSRQGTCRGHT